MRVLGIKANLGVRVRARSRLANIVGHKVRPLGEEY